MKKPKVEPDEINYCIGRPWNNGTDSINVYAYGTSTFYGSLQNAKDMRDFIESRPESMKNKEKYNIYMLTKVPE